MTLKLFRDDGDGDDDDISKIEINHDFARRYEHNKKREDLHRLEELKKKGLVESSDSSGESSDDETDILNPEKDLEFFDALLKVKKQDPVLKQKDVALFNSDEEDGEDGSRGNEKKKPMYLKDVTAKHLIEEGPEFEDKEAAKKSYYEEQEEMRREFLAAADEDEDGDGEFLKVKETEDGQDKADDGSGEFEKKLDEYFGEEAERDENALFLKEYFMKKMWIDKDKGGKVVDDDMEVISEDEEELEKQEEYEAGYNFRFQENAGDRVMGHSRTVEGSVRKKVNARKEQRKSKEERMKIAEDERKEELKHLKNLKKKEIKEKLNKIKAYAGIGEEEAWLLNEDNLEEDFDPEEYDRVMKAAFDDKYYNAQDANPEKINADDYDDDPDDIEKPDFDKEDELLGLPKGWDEVGSSDGFLAMREKILKQNAQNDNEEEEDEESDDGDSDEDEEGDEGDEDDTDKEKDSVHENEDEEEEEKEPEEGKRKRRKKLSLLKRAKEAMLDEYYKLDYEDTIGDLKTRFKYAKIKPNRYGLSTSEILMMDDKDLNQYVSLKKIAPYSEKEYKVKDSKRYQQKLKYKELLQKEKLGVKKSGKKKKRSKDDANKKTSVKGDMEDVEPQLEESKADDGSISRKAKRRRREAELKLPVSRLEAYGKISTKPKSKKKHRTET